MFSVLILHQTIADALLLLLFIAINIALLQFILPRVAPVGLIQLFTYSRINNQSINLSLIVIFNLLWSEFLETNATLRSDSTDLDHALVVCDLTQIPVEGSECRWGTVGIPDHDSLWGQVRDNQCVINFKICRSRSKR